MAQQVKLRVSGSTMSGKARILIQVCLTDSRAAMLYFSLFIYSFIQEVFHLTVYSLTPSYVKCWMFNEHTPCFQEAYSLM